MSAPAVGVQASAVLFKREVVRFVRQPARIVAALGTPALLWLFLASGFARSFAPQEGAAADNYAAFLLPGMATAVALFTAIFAALSLIEDRRAGFLQSVMVSPAPAWATVVSKSGGSALLATGQGALILLAAPLVGMHPTFGGMLLALFALALTSLAITGLGLAAAWWVDSSEGFHGVMNLVLMPMWLLSGAFFPAAGASTWLAWIMIINPLRWSTDAMRGALADDPRFDAAPWTVTIMFATLMLAAAWFAMSRSGAGAPRAARGRKKRSGS